ncbi:MAG: winged helix-turn-helix domain-containing protein [Stenotrophomonas sp.]|uniref:winged helix-turn-helix domain-containing protein n=1 Tax=Stenotrophomonas sp. TaxID=69392 RepID=UPI003D6D8CFC
MGSIQDPADTGQVIQRYRFDGIVVDAVAHTVCRDGQFQSLEPKAFAVLLLLLRHADELLVRDQLLDAVWGHRHVTPGVLTRAIAQLRSALDDHSHEPRYIQTQHGLGYRFIGKLLPPEVPHSTTTTVEQVPDSGTEAGLEMGGACSDGSADAEAPALPEPMPMPASRWTAGEPAANAPLSLWMRSRMRLIGLGLALLTLGAGVWWWVQGPGMRPAVADASIAVMPFSSLSDTAADRYFADGLAVEMHDALANVPGLNVAARQLAALGESASEGDDVRQIGRRLGVATLLDASVRREGGRVRISARLSDTRTGFTLWAETYDRENQDVFALQGEIASKVVHALLGHMPGSASGVARRLTPTHDVNAYDAYLRGLALLQRPVGESGNERAMEAFTQALAIDPQFARAQAGLCRAQIARLEGVSDAVAFDRARQACARAQEMSPGLREVSLAMADIARVSGQSEQALVLYQQVIDDPALRADGLLGLARTYGALGQEDRALDYFQQAIEARPSDAQIYRLLGYHHWLRGDLPKAIDAFVTATVLQPEDSRLWGSLGGLYLAQGDTVQAGHAFNMSLSIEPNAGALTNLGTMKFDGGEYDVAAGLFRQATVLEPEDYLHWGNLADALAAAPSTAAQAQVPYQRAASLAQQYVDVRKDDAYALALLSWYRANLGERERALADLRAARALGTQPAEIALWCAQTLSLLGDQTGAHRCIENALQQGVPQQRIDALLLQRHAPAAKATPLQSM